MSMLRKAKEKAITGMKAVNTERKKHFGSSRTGGASRASAQSTSYNFKQMKQTNDAFEAILDDDSDLFGLGPELKPVPQSVPSGDPLTIVETDSSNKSQHFDDDLFSDDFEPPSMEAHNHMSAALPALINAEETETKPANDITHQGSPSEISSERSSQDRDTVLGGEDTSEPTESTETENLLGDSSEKIEASDQGKTGPDILEPDMDPLNGGNTSSVDQNHTHSTLESESVDHKEGKCPPVVVLATKQDPSQDDLFSDTFPAEGPLSEDTLAPPTDAIHPPVTPLSSSFEDDSHLSPSTASPGKLRESREVSSEPSEDELTSTTALLDKLLAPKPKSDPSPQPVPTTTRETHLDSGIFDHESHKRSSSDDFFEVTEDHYRDTQGTDSMTSPHKPTTKRNSAGKLPPVRPPISPNVRRKLSEKFAKKDRIVADDLFEDDFVKVSYPTQSPLASSLQHTAAIDRHTPSPTIDKKDTPPPKVQRAEETRPKRQDSHMFDEPDLTLPYHLTLSLIIYIYYSFNPWSYLAGLFAGFLTVYLLVGAVFVWYVVTQEQERRETKREKSGSSLDFGKGMDFNFNAIRSYKSSKFMATFKYDNATHHPRERSKAHVKLEEDFFLTVHVYLEGPTEKPFFWREDLRQCTVGHAPKDIATERKRRWNKKFPIRIKKKHSPLNQVFLFCPTSRQKEDWFRRLRHAAEGNTSEQLIAHLEKFFQYMAGYFPSSSGGLPERKPHPVTKTKKLGATAGHSIQYKRESEDHSLLEESVSITRDTSTSRHSRLHTPPPQSGTNATRQSTGSTSIPPSVPSDILWLNAVAARMCWDIWHDQRWKDWVMSRIQKKLAKVKTPSFMEQLKLTGVDVGNDMPVVNKLCGGPKLNPRGMWVYLDVTYEGSFVMTIETKLKLGKKENAEQGQQMSVIKNKGFPATSPNAKHSSTGMSHTSAARALGSSVDPYGYDDSEIDSGSSDEESSISGHSIMDELHKVEEPHEDPVHTKRGSRLRSAVKKVGKKVANYSFVQRAFEKVSSYPLILTVEVKRLNGVLAVNIPPPCTDTIWFAFVKSPKLDLVAKPKLGQREVKLSLATQWIEKKLCELVDKKLVLPEMEDLVVKILNSGLPEDTQKVLVNEGDQT